MRLAFTASVQGQAIHCRISSDEALVAPVFCFSLMAPPAVVSGGELATTCGGYGEVALPDIPAGGTVEVVLRYADPAYRPVNRAWLPLGPYLRLADGTTHPLPALPAGVRPRASAQAAEPAPGLRLVPPPTSWEPSDETLLTRSFSGVGEPLAAVDGLSRRNALGRFLEPAGTPLTLRTDASMPAEAYRLEITPDAVAITAAGRAGHFYGAITLLNLVVTHSGALPCGTIEDAPRFGWRGQHLDCARHYYRRETLARLFDLMALFKLNRFHWHFADDEAFRLEVDCLPELWQKTAFRGEGELVPGVFGGGIRAGGSYSKSVVRDLIAHGRALNIEILPEIEVPAHALALNRAVPGLRDPDDTGTETSVQGYRENTINPAMPRTWDVVEALAGEVAALFPFGHLHLGCDELPPDTWAGSPAVAALKRRENLATTDDVRGWMMHRLAANLAAQGVRPAAWEEAARGRNGGIGNGALLFSWTGQGPGTDAARAGYDVVMCPAQNVYFDMAHTGDPDDWGAAWAAFVALEDTVEWSPVPASAPDIAGRVLGVQGTFWSEFTTADGQIEPMLAPRILGLATRAWEQTETTDGPALRALAAAYAPVFTKFGWQTGG